jgi:hypothetical protein
MTKEYCQTQFEPIVAEEDDQNVENEDEEEIGNIQGQNDAHCNVILMELVVFAQIVHPNLLAVHRVIQNYLHRINRNE